MKKFIAEDKTQMTFEMVEKVFGCQRFRICVDGQKDRVMTLSNPDTESNYKTLEIFCAGGMHHFNQLGLWKGSIENG